MIKMRKKIITKNHPLDFSELTETERYRLAMAVDTDGCITYNYYNNHSYAYPSFVFTGATELPFILWEKYGGELKNYRSNIYKWIITRRKPLQAFLRAVYPYSLVKKKQCEIALNMLALLLEKPTKLPGYPGWQQKTLNLVKELHQCNTDYKQVEIDLERL